MKLGEIGSNLNKNMVATQASAALREENERLKQQIELASETDSEFYRQIERLAPSPQARQTFHDQDIKERARSLLEEGQASPVILIPVDDGTKEIDGYIEDGELTWRAATYLVKEGHVDWNKLKCRWSSLSPDEDAHTKTLIHHRHKVNLNQLDEAEALMLEIAKAISWDEEEANQDKNILLKPILGGIASKYRTSPEFSQLYDSLLTKTREESAELLDGFDPKLASDNRTGTTILQLLRFTVRNPKTFYDKYLPLVFLPKHAKEAIRHSTNPIGSRHALLISTIKDDQVQKDLLEQCQANGWSLKQLKEAISMATVESAPQQPSKSLSFRQQKSAVSGATKALTKSNIKALTPKQAGSLAKSLRAKLEILEARAQEDA